MRLPKDVVAIMEGKYDHRGVREEHDEEESS